MRLLSLGNLFGRVSDRHKNIIWTALLFMVVFGLVDYIADYAMNASGIDNRLHAALQATFVGTVAAVTVYLLLRARGERRRVINDEIKRVIELNHSLRNALEIIAHSHYAASEEVRKTMLLETAQKMSDKLTELFPTIAPDRRRPQSACNPKRQAAMKKSAGDDPENAQRLA